MEYANNQAEYCKILYGLALVPGSANKGSSAVQIGMTGPGRMGANMVRRLMRAGHECVVYDRNPQAG